MALSSGFDNNLAMPLLGVSMAGGLAYGGYVVFKNKPTAVTELLKSKKRVLLTRETEDEDLWKLQNWKVDRANKEKVPESFKTKCLSWENEKLDGTWTKEYKNIEKYCSKAEVSEESET